MASKLGTVFVELSLDDKVYKQKLSETLTSTQTTARGIETSWKALGSKSEALFDAQRRAAQNAYTLIAAASGKASQDAIRAQQAAADKIKQINEQQFGHQTSLLDSLKKNWMALSAIAVAVYATVIKPIEAYMESEKALLKMGMAMKNQGDYTRAALADMEAFSKEIQRTTAFEDDATLAIMANMKSYGMSNEEVKRATKVALDFATAKENEGMTVEKASEILGKSYLGITTGLKKLGIQIDENATGAAVFESVMAQLNQRFGGSAQADLLTYSGQWKQLKNEWQDVQEFLGLVFLKTIEGLKTAFLGIATAFWAVVTGIVQGLTWIAKGLEDFQRAIGMEGAANATKIWAESLQWATDSAKAATQEAARMTAGNYKAMVSFDSVSGAINKMGIAGKRTVAIDEEAEKAAKKWAAEKEAAIKSITEAIRKADYEIEGIGKSQYDKDIARINSEAEKYRKAGVDKVKVEKFVALETIFVKNKAAEEADKITQKSLDEEAKAWGVYADEVLKSLEEIQQEIVKDVREQQKTIEKALDDEAKYWGEYAQEVLDELAKIGKGERELTADEKKLAADRLNAYHDLYKDLKRYERDYYESSKAIVLKQEEDYRTLLIDKNTSAEDAARIEILLAQRTAEELENIEIKKLKAGNNFFDGIKAGWKELEKDTISWGTVGADVVKEFTKEAKKQLSDNLFNMLTGKFDDLGADWEGLWKSMLRTLTDKLAEMAVEAAAAKVWDLLGSGWDWFGLIFAAEGIWDVEGMKEGIPIIAHPGEMIVPADLAEQIRNAYAGGGEGETAGFQNISDMMSGVPAGTIPGYGAFLEGTGKAYGNIALQGALQSILGNITTAQLIAGLSSPQALASAVIRGGIPAAIADIFSLPDVSKTGYSIAYGIATVLGAKTGVAIAAALVGMFVTAAVTDIVKGVQALTMFPISDVFFPTTALEIENAKALAAVMAEQDVAIASALESAAQDAAIASALAGLEGLDLTGLGGLDLTGLSGLDLTGLGGLDLTGLGGFGQAFGGDFGQAFGGDGGGFGGDGGGFGGDGGGFGGDGGGFGGGFGGDGFAKGGISSGPLSGYWARLHGTEAIIPLKSRNGPVENKGRTLIINSPLIHIEGNLIADQQTFDEFVEKIDYALDKRSRRVYAS